MIKPFHSDIEMGSGQRRLFQDDHNNIGGSGGMDSASMAQNRPFTFDTPIGNKYKLFEDNNPCVVHSDPFKKDGSSMGSGA